MSSLTHCIDCCWPLQPCACSHVHEARGESFARVLPHVSQAPCCQVLHGAAAPACHYKSCVQVDDNGECGCLGIGLSHTPCIWHILYALSKDRACPCQKLVRCSRHMPPALCGSGSTTVVAVGATVRGNAFMGATMVALSSAVMRLSEFLVPH
jgi:hypothetical protein